MSTYVLMRILESAPRRYDLGMRLLSLGRVTQVYDRLAARIEAGQRVLDVGCGTGALALRAARRGASVKGIDVNAAMLAVAAQRARKDGLAARIELVESGVAELDREAPASYDVVTSGLCFSELSDDEIAYTLRQVRRILKPGGLLLVADEGKPGSRAVRVLRGLARAPLAALTWLLTQQTSHAITNLPERLAGAGFAIASVHASGTGGLMEIVARRPTGDAS